MLFYQLFGRVPPSRIDYRKKGTSLLEDLDAHGELVGLGSRWEPLMLPRERFRSSEFCKDIGDGDGPGWSYGQGCYGG